MDAVTPRFQGDVRKLDGRELAELIGCLGRDCDENGITGELLGVCLEESVRRLRGKDVEGLKVERSKDEDKPRKNTKTGHENWDDL